MAQKIDSFSPESFRLRWQTPHELFESVRLFYLLAFLNFNEISDNLSNNLNVRFRTFYTIDNNGQAMSADIMFTSGTLLKRNFALNMYSLTL